MDKETAISILNDLNTNIVPIVDKIFFNKLGVTTKMKAIYSVNRSGEYYFTLINEDNSDVNKKMRGNKILRYLFKSAELKAQTWYFDEDNCYDFYVNVYYEHNDGGSNGHELMRFYINKTTKTIHYK